jgi:N-acetylglucosaminyldiphosphoundecaprenol N-acetyl-beta-D-mannosaminyltransferase
VEYEKILKSSDLALNDGVGVSFAAQVFGKKLPGRVPGADLVERVCGELAKKPITVGFLGGKGDVAQRTAERLKEKYPGLKVAYALEEWPQAEKASLKTDILFVAFGSPKQEKWIYEHLEDLNVKIVMGVGGTFDFISGKVKRAPVWMRKAGLEWFFRLIMQPWRVKRQIHLIHFLFLIIIEKMGI